MFNHKYYPTRRPNKHRVKLDINKGRTCEGTSSGYLRYQSCGVTVLIVVIFNFVIINRCANRVSSIGYYRFEHSDVYPGNIKIQCIMFELYFNTFNILQNKFKSNMVVST